MFLIFDDTGFYSAVSPSTWSNWALVIVAIIAAWAAIRTIQAIRNQTDLQRAGMVQWMEISEWQCGFRDDTKKLLRVQFSLNNPTNFPLTISKFTVGFMGYEISPKEPMPRDFGLNPKTPIAVSVDMILPGPELIDYELGNGLMLRVSIIATHSDMGPNGVTEMIFQGTLFCRHGQKPLFSPHNNEFNPVR